jgi:hypothetical protein
MQQAAHVTIIVIITISISSSSNEAVSSGSAKCLLSQCGSSK